MILIEFIISIINGFFLLLSDFVLKFFFLGLLSLDVFIIFVIGFFIMFLEIIVSIFGFLVNVIFILIIV